MKVFHVKRDGHLRNQFGVNHPVTVGDIITLDNRGLAGIQKRVTLHPPDVPSQTYVMRHVVGRVDLEEMVPKFLERLGEGIWEPLRGTVLLRRKCPDCGSPSHEATGWALGTNWILCGPCARQLAKWFRAWTGKRPPSKHKGKAPLFYEAAVKVV